MMVSVIRFPSSESVKARLLLGLPAIPALIVIDLRFGSVTDTVSTSRLPWTFAGVPSVLNVASAWEAAPSGPTVSKVIRGEPLPASESVSTTLLGGVGTGNFVTSTAHWPTSSVGAAA